MSTELEIRVTAELREIRAALASLTTQIDRVGERANASANGGRALGGALGQAAVQARGAAAATSGIQTGIARAVTQAKLLLGSLGALGTLTALVRMADTATRLDGQLRLVTKSTEELNRAQQATFSIAQRTRQGLEATVGLYARIARAGRTTQEQTLQLTEAINQAVALSFTTAQAGEAALFQLGQGLGSGTLRGEELNSVLEQTPRLAQAIAEGLVALGRIQDPGELRAFAQKNGIEAKLVVDAIASQQARLREEFAKLKPTVADAFTALKNAGLAYVRDANSQTGATNGLANAIIALANNFKLLADAIVTGGQIFVAYFVAFRAAPAIVGALATAFTAVRASIALATPAMTAAAAQAAAITAGFGGAATSVTAFNLALTGSALAAAGWAVKLKAAAAVAFAAFAGFKIGEYLREQFLEAELFGIALAAGLHKVAFGIGHSFKTTGVVIREAFATAFNWVKERAAGMLEDVARAYGTLPSIVGAPQAALAGAAAKAIRDSIQDTEGVTAAYKRLAAEGEAGLAAIELGYSDLADAAIAARQPVEEVATTAAEASGAPAAGIRALADQFALLKDAAERALAALDRLYADAGISVAAYFAEKVRLQQAAIDADIAAARAAADSATSVEERRNALTQLVILERQRREVATLAARDQTKAEDELVDKLGEVKIRLLELQGQGAEARRLALETQYLELFQRLGVEGDKAGKDLVRKLINVEAAKAGLDQLKGEFSDTMGQLSQLEQTIAAQVSAGLLSNSTAEERLTNARAVAIEQLTVQRQKVAELYAAYKDPGAALELQRIDEQIATLSRSVDDWRGKVQDAGTSALTTFFTDIASGAKSAGEAVRDLAVNFTQALAQMAAEALAKRAMKGIMDLFTQDQGGGDAGTQVATAAAAGLAYATPVQTAAGTLALAGGTVASGAAALAVSAAALQAAASTLLIANAASSASGVAHTGGVVGALNTFRNVSPLVFAGAPRYHSGGIAGLAADEVPTILRRGEEVLTRQDARHRYNGGLGAQSDGQRKNLRIIMVDDQRRVADYLNSPEGDEVQMEFISRNAGAIREVLGSF